MFSKNIIFIDSRVSNDPSPIADLAEHAEVFVLDSESDGLTQMVAWLQGRAGVDAIHVISHGSVGALYLGSTVQESGNLSSCRVQLDSLARALTAGRPRRSRAPSATNGRQQERIFLARLPAPSH